jgi:hypothetical protein
MSSDPGLTDWVCRCHDDACARNGECLRWLGRHDERERLAHRASLRDAEHGMSCPHYLGVGREERADA